MLEQETNALRKISLLSTKHIQVSIFSVLAFSAVAILLYRGLTPGPADRVFYATLFSIMPASAFIYSFFTYQKWIRRRDKGIVIMAAIGGQHWYTNGFRMVQILYEFNGKQFQGDLTMHRVTQLKFISTRLPIVINPARPRDFVPLFYISTSSRETRELLAGDTSSWVRRLNM